MLKKYIKNYQNKINEQLKIDVENKNWKFIEVIRDQKSVKVKCLCDQDHLLLVSCENIRNNQGCKICLGYDVPIEEVEKILNARNWKLLSDHKKITNKTKIKCQCNHEHVIEMRYNKIKENTKCYKCINNPAGIPKDINEVISIIESFGLKLLNPQDYKNNMSELIVQCNKFNHITKSKFTYLCTSKNKCKKCFNQSNFSETIVRNHLKLLTDFEWIKIKPMWLNSKNSTNKKHNLEIDCWCEELNAGVEVDGKQHHHFTKPFHKTIQTFYDQQSKDRFKIEKCKELNKILIKIRALDYFGSIEEMLYYLEEELIKHNIITEEQRKYINNIIIE